MDQRILELEARLRDFKLCTDETPAQTSVRLLPIYIETMELFKKTLDEDISQEVSLEVLRCWKSFQAKLVDKVGMREAIHILFIMTQQYKQSRAQIDFSSLDIGPV